VTTILLLPGLDGTGLLFKWFEACAPKWLECTSVRYPDRPRWGYPDYVRYVLDECIPDGPFVVLGESFSGPVAIEVAASEPKGLLGLALCNTFAVRPGPGALRFLPWEMILGRRISRFTAGLHLVGTRLATELAPEIRHANSQVSAAAKAARLRAVFRVDVRPSLRKVSQPAIHLRGTRDRLVPYWSLRQTEKANPNLAVARIPGPHLLLQAAPEQCWNEIINHLPLGPAA
jgi:pimeloyl-[acyl-carrier protein] methyl ester esterase